MFRIGIVGPQNTKSIPRLISVAQRVNSYITYIPVPYEGYDDLFTKLTALQKDASVDGILFSGFSPFEYATRTVAQEVPWEYADRDASGVLGSLLKAVTVDKRAIGRISSDLLDRLRKPSLLSLFKEYGIPVKTVIQYEWDGRSQEHIDQVCSFHIKNLTEGRADICLTALREVQSILTTKGLPVIYVEPSEQGILEKLNHLCGSISRVTDTEYPCALVDIILANNMISAERGVTDYSLFRMETDVLEQVYFFAEQVKGAVERNGTSRFRVYCSYQELNGYSGKFHHLPVLEKIASLRGVEKVTAGIGVSRNPANARRNAASAANLALLQTASCFFLCTDQKEMIGPIAESLPPDSQEQLPPLEEIAKKSGVSLRNIHSIHETLKPYGTIPVTAQNLAQITGMTISNTNRILARLIASGYASVVGYESHFGAGRPYRLFRIDFEHIR